MVMTAAPSSGRRMACSRPWPRAAPVMKATFPSTRPISFSALSGFTLGHRVERFRCKDQIAVEGLHSVASRPDPPRTEEMIAVNAAAATVFHGARRLIVVLWRAGLRIQEALDLSQLDLDRRRGSVLVRRGKGGRRREVGMDDWGFEHLEPWLREREQMPIGPLFCVIDGRTRGRAWYASAARAALRRRAAQAGVRRRFAPHQLSHAHAIELAREGVPLNVIQRQLGHRNLGVTSIYLQG